MNLVELISIKKRILDISYIHKLSHLSSCFTALPMIIECYERFKEGDRFILSAGHSALALYAVLEHYKLTKIDAEQLFIKHGVHPNRDVENGLWVSTGSLGIGICVGVGMAIAHPHNKVYCICTDGECAEGSVYEALRFAQSHKVNNLEVHINANGFGAYDKVDVHKLEQVLKSINPEVIFHRTDVEFDFLKGQQGHYKVMQEEDYDSALAQLTNI